MGLGMTEIILVLVIALLIIGPEKLPGLAVKLGRGWADVKRTVDDVRDTITMDVRDSAVERARKKQIQQEVENPAPVAQDQTDQDGKPLAEQSGNDEPGNDTPAG